MTTFAERYAEIDAAIESYNRAAQRGCVLAEELTLVLDQLRIAVLAEARALGLKQRDVKARLGTFDWTYRAPAVSPAPPAEPPLDIPAIDAAVAAASEPAIVHGDPFEIPPHLRKAPPGKE